jgi:hypothetical protein
MAPERSEIQAARPQPHWPLFLPTKTPDLRHENHQSITASNDNYEIQNRPNLEFSAYPLPTRRRSKSASAHNAAPISTTPDGSGTTVPDREKVALNGP